MKKPSDGLVCCPHCGQETPGENLNCIYCGELLDEPLGPLTGLLYGGQGRLGLILALLVAVAILVWLL